MWHTYGYGLVCLRRRAGGVGGCGDMGNRPPQLHTAGYDEVIAVTVRSTQELHRRAGAAAAVTWHGGQAYSAIRCVVKVWPADLSRSASAAPIAVAGVRTPARSGRRLRSRARHNALSPSSPAPAA